ncbi:fungal specific transcription factor domain protein [Ceraceosorus bombacis]|uniref:Fungal specific transcription factor domain protein n=1 Tax=Ceraceosorus bombacis TaxID=401625 RepID=A0A0P1BB64_9BASI|nr:fungal specific transcription factor domain protein [Ceraceosorus bombacis]
MSSIPSLAALEAMDLRPKYKNNCGACRKRKLKCDRVKPCSTCVLRDISDQCFVDEPEPTPPLRPGFASHAAHKRLRTGDAEHAGSSHHVSHRSSAHVGSSGAGGGQTVVGGSPSSASASTPPNGHHRNTILESVQAQLADTQRQLLVLSQSLATLQSDRLQAAVPLTESSDDDAAAGISWQALFPLLPTLEACHTLVERFFVDALWYIPVIHKTSFVERVWIPFASGRAAVTRPLAAVICLVLAYPLQLCPDQSDITRHKSLGDACDIVDRLVREAFKLTANQKAAWGPFKAPQCNLPLIQALLLQLVFLSIVGSMDPALPLQADVIARAHYAGYFRIAGMPPLIGPGLPWDERGAPKVHDARDERFSDERPEGEKLPILTGEMPAGSALETEYRRRIAWTCFCHAGWFALVTSTQPLISMSDFLVPRPTFLTDEHFDPLTGQVLTEISEEARAQGLRQSDADRYLDPYADYLFGTLESSFATRRVADFFHRLPSMSAWERHEAVRIHENAFEQFVTASGNNLAAIEKQWRKGTEIGNNLAAIETQWRKGTEIGARCADSEAPLDIRFKSLEHARNLFEMMPLMMEMASDPTVPFNSAWCATHVFHAATAYAIAIFIRRASVDPSNPGSDGTPSPHEVDEEVRWFKNNIAETLRILRTLGTTNSTAKICEELLQALCDSREELELSVTFSRNVVQQHRIDRERRHAQKTRSNLISTQSPSLTRGSYNRYSLLAPIEALPGTQNRPPWLSQSSAASPPKVRSSIANGPSLEVFGQRPARLGDRGSEQSRDVPARPSESAAANSNANSGETSGSKTTSSLISAQDWSNCPWIYREDFWHDLVLASSSRGDADVPTAPNA